VGSVGQWSKRRSCYQNLQSPVSNSRRLCYYSTLWYRRNYDATHWQNVAIASNDHPAARMVIAAFEVFRDGNLHPVSIRCTGVADCGIMANFRGIGLKHSMVGFLRSLLNTLDITASPYAIGRWHCPAYGPSRPGSKFLFRMSQNTRANNRMA
jgi:hypothetical protein